MHHPVETQLRYRIHVPARAPLPRAKASLSSPQVLTRAVSSRRNRVPRQFRIAPMGEVVMVGRRVLVEQALDQIAAVVEDEHHGLQSESAELAHLLNSEMMGSSPVMSRTRRGYPVRQRAL